MVLDNRRRPRHLAASVNRRTSLVTASARQQDCLDSEEIDRISASGALPPVDHARLDRYRRHRAAGEPSLTEMLCHDIRAALSRADEPLARELYALYRHALAG